MKFSLKNGHKGFLLILLFGIVFLIAAVICQVATDKKIKEWVPTDAKVAAYKRDIRKNSDGETEFVYIAVLSWTADGVEYRGECSEYFNIIPTIGSTYKILYNPKDPKKFVEIDNGIHVEILLYAIGGILSCAGLVFFLVSCRDKPNK